MRKLVAGILTCAMVFSMAVVPGKETDAASQVTIASLDYVYTGTADQEVENGVTTFDLNKVKYGSKKKGYVFTKGAARLYASVNGDKKRKLEWSSDENKSGVDEIKAVYKKDGVKTVEPVMAAGKKDATVQWQKGSTPYFEVELSTKGYKDITFSAYVGATKKGPKDYALSYATGTSKDFKRLTDSTAKLSLTDNKKMYQIKGKLPAACNDNSTVKVRVEIASMNTLDTDPANKYLYQNPTKGEAAINNILIQGTKAPVATASSSSSSTATSTTAAKGKVKKVTLNKKKLTLKKGKSFTLKATIKATSKSAKKAAKKKMKWISSDKKVVTVKKGKVVAKGVGTAKVTVKYSKKIKAVCKVTVK